MPKAICEDCGSLVDAELTHNGVCPVGHYVHCGWGHQLSPEDLIPDDLIPAGVTDHIKAQAAEIERLQGALAKLIGGAETVLEAWDHHMRDVVVPAALNDAVEEMRADVAGAEGGKDEL